MTHVAWLESLSPWPKDGFGVGRMRALLAELGEPQLAYPSIHVVGTNGKTTTARTIEATLAREGLLAACYTSPHVTGWSERVRVGGEEIDVERALARVRGPGERLQATQFEVLTAAALAEFAASGVDVAVVEAGLGGRHDATNVLRSPAQVLTNVALEHTDVLGSTRELIAAEQLAVVQPGATVCLGEAEWEPVARANGAARVVVETGGNEALAGAAASAFLGRAVGSVGVMLPGRLEQLDAEIRDGAHTPDAIRYVSSRLPRLGSVVVSVLADKDVDGILEQLGRLAGILVATRSSSPRALPAEELAERAAAWFEQIEVVPDPAAAVARAHELGEPVLVTGSLYLLADLAARRPAGVP
jgi:dihydrofolate synthase/folylpolyglutamate synthase